MSAFNRFMQASAGRRAYSYFSSRSGGGRHFTSAKPPKTAVVAPKGAVTTGNNQKVDATAEGKQDNVRGASPQNNVVSSANPITESSPSSPVQRTSSQTNGIGSESSTTGRVAGDQPAFSNNNLEPTHNRIPLQTIDVDDFKMHQFFSLHRPLLLLPKPSSLFRDTPTNHSFLDPPPITSAEIYRRVMQGLSGLGDSEGAAGSPQTEASVIDLDADAEAARQLTRALTLSKAGATLSWENTLQKLGLDISKDADRVNLEKQFEKDWEEVMMDSTKRKRRKKMKKHKYVFPVYSFSEF